MSVKIRLKCFGAKSRLQWRIVVADARSPRDGRFIEEVGYYDALPAEEKIHIKKDRVEYWVQQGAQVSPTVKSLLKRLKKKEKKVSAS